MKSILRPHELIDAASQVVTAGHRSILAWGCEQIVNRELLPDLSMPTREVPSLPP